MADVEHDDAEIDEISWIRGNKAAWRRVLLTAMKELDDCPEKEQARRVMERSEIVDKLREVCAEHGDNDWPDNLWLPDVIEKHLMRHLEDG